MLKRTLVLFLICLAHTIALRAQCPASDSVFRRIAWLRNNAPPDVQIQELVQLESQVRQGPNSNDSTYDMLLRRIGFLYLDESDFTHAVYYLSKACDVIAANFNTPRINSQHIITYYYYIAEAYGSLHKIAEKRHAREECIGWSLRMHTPSDIAAVRCLYAGVESLFDIGDYNRCGEDALHCERMANEYAGTVTGRDLAIARSLAESSHGWCIQSLLRMRDFDSAEHLLTNKAAQYKKNKLTSYLGFINTELAELQLHKNNPQKALDYFNLALRYYKAEGKEFNYKQTLKAVGEELWFNFYHNIPKALSCYRAALQHNLPPAKRGRVDSIEDASIWNNMANAYVQLNNFDSAFYCFGHALNLVKPGADETNILDSSDEIIDTYKKLHYLASLLIDEADAWRKKYILTADKAAVAKADYIYRVADKLLGRINAAQPDLQSRLFWRADTRRLYEHAIDLCHLQRNAAAAFYFFERSRAVLLNDQLTEQWMQGGDAIARQAVVKRQLLQLNRQLSAAGTPAHAAIGTALYAARQELDSLERQIKAHSPLYYQGFIDSSYITINDVRTNLLADHSSLLEIFYGDSAVYTLLTTAGNSWLDRIDKTSYDNAVNSYLDYLGDVDLLNRDFGGYTRVAQTLYSLLFGNHTPPEGRMIVSPDGRSFPLEALITGTGSTPRWMLYKYAISYTYSARYLQNNFAVNAGKPVGDFLGVAPVHFKGTPLPTLNGSDVSLGYIGHFFGTALNLVTDDATREHFRHAFPNYRVIQLYTHSSDSSDQKEPVIYFADSSLYLSELIPESRPAAQLIVLSACETGNGRFYRGEGVFSFNRGFAAMGIPASVSNLWSIDNTSTYHITQLFYQYLSDGLAVDLALQQAKLEFIRSSSSSENELPYYWAASIIIGKTNAINYPHPFNWRWIAYGVLLLVLAWLLYRLFFKRK